MIDEILKKFNVKYEDLNVAEKDTLNMWLSSAQGGAMSSEKIKDHIRAMRDAVEQELCKVGHETTQDIFLKARLRNYMLLEAFLTSPERAKKQLEIAISNISSGAG